MQSVVWLYVFAALKFLVRNVLQCSAGMLFKSVEILEDMKIPKMYCNSNNCVIFVFKALKICRHKNNDYIMARNEGWLECNERYQNDPSINEEKWYPSIQLSSNAQNVLIAVEKNQCG